MGRRDEKRERFWEIAEERYKNGDTFRQIAEDPELTKQYGPITHQGISKHARKHGWVKDLTPLIRERARNLLALDGVQSEDERAAIEEAAQKAVNVYRLHHTQTKLQASLVERLGAMLVKRIEYLEGLNNPSGEAIGDAIRMCGELTKQSQRLVELDEKLIGLAPPDTQPNEDVAGVIQRAKDNAERADRVFRLIEGGNSSAPRPAAPAPAGDPRPAS